MRARLLEKRQKIPLAIRRIKSRKIFGRVFANVFFCQARRVALYHDVPPEVETRPFLRKILREKEVFLSKVELRTGTLTLRRVRSLTKDLQKGVYSIREPKGACVRRPASEMDLIIVPGVGFDRRGNRLGRGGGYYDRLLRKAKKVRKIGICFREQIVKKIPATRLDVRVDRVITD